MTRTERIEAARVMSGDGPWECRIRSEAGPAPWISVITPCWDWERIEYREVPKPPPPPVLRPWDAREVPMGAFYRQNCRHSTRMSIVGVEYNDAGETCVYLGNGSHITATQLRDEWTLWDGTPCGVMVVPGEATHAIRTDGDHA
jgi:hypothetical protein